MNHFCLFLYLLLQVMETYDGGSRLLIRCIPRINLSALSLPAEQRKGFRASRGPRPPQRYFDRQEVRGNTRCCVLC